MFADLWIKAAIVVTALVVMVAGKMFFNLQSDNPVEEIAEEVVEKETGLKIDLEHDNEDKK